MDLDQAVYGKLGDSNGSYADLIGVFFELSGVQFYNAGLWFLGRFQDNAKGVVVPTHQFVFTSHQALTLTMEVHFNTFFSNLPSRLIVNGSFTSVRWNNSVAYIQIPIQSPSTTVEISMSEGTPSFVTIDNIIWH